MKLERHHCHTQAAVAAQISQLRQDWHRAMHSTAAVLQRTPDRSRLAAPLLPIGPRPTIEMPCR